MALSVTDFVVERLLEFDPTFDTGGGIATTALMINPLSVILQPLRDELDEIQANQSILSVLESDSPDDFDEEIVDALASNVIIDRNTGSVSSGTVRIRFFSAQDVDIGTGLASFLDAAGNRYFNVNPISITAAEMGLNIDGSLFYVDVPVESEEEATAGNLEIGGIQSFENEPANVANVTNLAKFSNGLDRETNTELIDRISVAVTVRALVTGRGIITTMTDNFSSIQEINPRGMGDPEMQRDIVFNVHVGGHTDVWVKTPEFSELNFDVLSVAIDTTRRARAKSSLVLETTSATSLRHSSIDRTDFTPTAVSSDGFITFIEGALNDFTMDDSAGTVTRIATGNILHETGVTGPYSELTDGIASNAKILADSGIPWTLVRPGMQLKITAPASVAGTYYIKTAVSTQLTIFGTFPDSGASVGAVTWQVDDIVTFDYEYNPIAIDIIQTARSSARTDFTITDVPMMKLKTIEELDPSTLGAFGVGTAADYVLRVITPNLRYSVQEDNYIDLVTGFLGFNLRVTYDTSVEIATYQTFIDDAQNRVEAAELVAKHFIPVFVNTTAGGITYRVKASNTSALSAAAVQTAVDSLIENTAIKTDIELSDIVDLLYNSGADQVDLNFGLQGEIHHTDGTIEFVDNTAEGVLVIPNNLPTDDSLTDTDKPLSNEIAHFISGTLTLTRVTT
jgi:hypothetical protein